MMREDVMHSDCRWPALDEPYAAALRQAVDYVLAHLDVSGIIASGSIIRGNPDPASDLDIYVVHARPQRQRLQRFFHGVPTELFVNPPQSIRRYFAAEQRDGGPSTAHMLVTGSVVLKRDPVVDELIAEAHDWLAKTPDLDEATLTQRRYFIADRFENAVDLHKRDPITARLLLYNAVFALLGYRFLAANRHRPRDKELLSALADLDAPLAQQMRDFDAAPTVAAQIAIAREVMQAVIGVTGFFEWEIAAGGY